MTEKTTLVLRTQDGKGETGIQLSPFISIKVLRIRQIIVKKTFRLKVTQGSHVQSIEIFSLNTLYTARHFYLIF